MKRVNQNIDWFHPKGRWCLISVCPQCGLILRDTATESCFSRVKWGKSIAIPPRTNGSYFNKSGICEECEKIRYCDLCDKKGNQSTIYVRNDVYGWEFDGRNDYIGKSKTCLCMACWNKVRAIVNKENEADECRKLLNKLTRSISNERKNQNHRRTT